MPGDAERWFGLSGTERREEDAFERRILSLSKGSDGAEEFPLSQALKADIFFRPS